MQTQKKNSGAVRVGADQSWPVQSAGVAVAATAAACERRCAAAEGRTGTSAGGWWTHA